jgi:hypothetical protein
MTEKLDSQLNFRVTLAEYEKLKAAAARAGKPLSTWCRDAVNEEIAARELADLKAALEQHLAEMKDIDERLERHGLMLELTVYLLKAMFEQPLPVRATHQPSPWDPGKRRWPWSRS